MHLIQLFILCFNNKFLIIIWFVRLLKNLHVCGLCVERSMEHNEKVVVA